MSKSCVSRDQDFDCVSLILDTFLGLPFLRTIRDHKNHKFKSMNQSDFHTNVFIQNFLVDMLGSVPPSILSSEYWNDIDARHSGLEERTISLTELRLLLLQPFLSL